MYAKFFSDFFRVNKNREKEFQGEKLGEKLVERCAAKFETYHAEKEEMPPLEISNERKQAFINQSEGCNNYFKKQLAYKECLSHLQCRLQQPSSYNRGAATTQCATPNPYLGNHLFEEEDPGVSAKF